MKTIPGDPRVAKMLWESVKLRDRWHIAVEGGVEAGYLWHLRVCLGCRTDARKREWRVLRVNLPYLLDCGDYLGVTI